MKKSNLLINEPPLQVQASLALKIGLEEAIVLQQLHYWINNPKNEGRIHEGEKWVYNTYSQWKEDNFPFWSEDKIQRIFLSLEKQGVVISKQIDSKSRDMTKFYRIAWDVLCVMDDAILRPSNTANLHDVNMNQRIPENTSIEDSSNSKPAKIVGIEASIFEGRKTTDEDINPTKIAHDALVAFEASFGVNTEKGQMLAWYGRKPEWNRLRKDVVELYQADPQCFEKYKAWRLTPYVKGAVSLKDVQRDPKCFMASWVAFVEATQVKDEVKIQLPTVRIIK